MANIYDMSKEICERLYDEMLDRMLAECSTVSDREVEGIEINEAGELLRGGGRKDSLAGEIVRIIREDRTQH